MMIRRPGSRIFGGAVVAILIFITIAYIKLDLNPPPRHLVDDDFVVPERIAERLLCTGADGEKVDSVGRGYTLEIPYPTPVGGSYEALGLSQTWMTADQRYGPYGYGSDRENYTYPKVNWETKDWKALQTECLVLNSHRYPNVQTKSAAVAPKLRMKTLKEDVDEAQWERPPRTKKQKYGRTAVVIRSWDSYVYTEKDMANLRSLITEASLDTQGEYEVFLLVHVRDVERRIFDDEHVYDDVLREVVPAELRNITVLFDFNLLESWYPKTPTHIPEWQMFQALQLLAQEADQFDHYWQLEMDVRFTGNSREWLDQMSSFSRQQPRRQSWERSSYFYLPEVHGTYAQFTASMAEAAKPHHQDEVNDDYDDKKTTSDASTQSAQQEIYGPMPIPDIEPQGPRPPFARAQDDDFKWGVGEDADVIVTAPAKDVAVDEEWVYREWVFNFAEGKKTPRWLAPPAIARGSWNILNAVHTAQVKKGLAIPSESTLVSFALWHGFKLVCPPQPWWVFPRHSQEELDVILNDGPPRPGKLAAMGDAKKRPTKYNGITHTATWWWASTSPGLLYDRWLNAKPFKRPLEDIMEGESEWAVEGDLPYIMHIVDGQVWMPNLALHPVKTNKNPK